MKQLTIIVPNGQNNLESIVGTYNIFKRANEHWKKSNKSALFAIQLAGISNEVGFYDKMFTVKPHTVISEIATTNLIIIPSLNHNSRPPIKVGFVWASSEYRDEDWAVKK